VEFLRELTSLEAVTFWDIPLIDISALYELRSLRHLRRTADRPPIEFAKVLSLRTDVWHHLQGDSGDKKLMCVPLTKRDRTIEPGNPFELFQTRIVEPTLVLFQYDVSPDGEEFLINSLPRADAAAPLSLLVNWEEIGG
jgi:hypothetical protein